jgi:hypothetical protein
LAENLTKEVKVVENGRSRRISKLEAAVKQLVDRAASGDSKQMHQLFALTQWAEGHTDSPTPATESLTDIDREVIAHIYARLKLYDAGDDHA